MKVHGIYSTGYIVSSLGYIVHGFESIGYLVSRVWGTSFLRYWGTGYGHIISHYPDITLCHSYG